MTPSRRLERTAGRIKRYVSRLDDEVVSAGRVAGTDRSAERDGDYVYINADRGGQYYSVYLEEHEVWGSVKYRYNFVRQLAANIAATDAVRFLEKQGVSVPEGDDKAAEKAARTMLRSLSGESMDELDYELSETIASPHTSRSIRWEDDIVEGFTVGRRIFPTNEAFGLRTFEEAVQSVVSCGRAGGNYLSYRFNFDRVQRESDAIPVEAFEQD